MSGHVLFQHLKGCLGAEIETLKFGHFTNFSERARAYYVMFEGLKVLKY